MPLDHWGACVITVLEDDPFQHQQGRGGSFESSTRDPAKSRLQGKAIAFSQTLWDVSTAYSLRENCPQGAASRDVHFQQGRMTQ